MRLSEDGRRLSGKNQLGSGVSATRIQLPDRNGIAGRWKWFNRAIVNFFLNGSCEATNGFVGNWQVLSSGEYEIQWRLPGQRVRYIDTMHLSEDGRHLSGKNQLGSGVSAIRTAQ